MKRYLRGIWKLSACRWHVRLDIRFVDRSSNDYSHFTSPWQHSTRTTTAFKYRVSIVICMPRFAPIVCFASWFVLSWQIKWLVFVQHSHLFFSHFFFFLGRMNCNQCPKSVKNKLFLWRKFIIVCTCSQWSRLSGFEVEFEVCLVLVAVWESSQDLNFMLKSCNR